jgi:hypothetical protein
MMPKEITSAFAAAATTFHPIVGQPTDDDLMALQDVLLLLLLQIPYNKVVTHNLIGLLEPTTYAVTWHVSFPIPAQPPIYPAIPNAATSVI